ncbi:MAG TPA: exodeoxyribonuclease III [Candidatus Omnitrophota bacterium]|nr:exodeoxyribonuclease III [Candidatus Omnitrophota bacterium]
MASLEILSWNVNGIRAGQKKGFLEWLSKKSPDILCVQETKAHPEQLDASLLAPKGYHTYWTVPVRKGYSGVATFTKQKPASVKTGIGVPRFDEEGRVLLSEFKEFTLLNIYFPNGKSGPERLRYKMDFYEEILRFTSALKANGKPVIVSGDYNTAHKPIDLARPEANQNVSGFLPIEREWIDRWIGSGQIDIFRRFHPEPGQYTWWDMKTNARARNVGWRIDYHFVSKELIPRVKDASLLPEIPGSDHCPISLKISL